jgi:hypothetical protein
MLSESPYALKTAWRFVHLVYGSCALLGPLFYTSPYWTPPSWGFGGAILIVSAFAILLLLACGFALAGVGWALCSFIRDAVTFRRSAVFALAANLIAATALTAYFLSS